MHRKLKFGSNILLERDLLEKLHLALVAYSRDLNDPLHNFEAATCKDLHKSAGERIH